MQLELESICSDSENIKIFFFVNTEALVFIVQKLEQIERILSFFPECLIMCALEHIGATFKVKWLLEKFLCAFIKQ